MLDKFRKASFATLSFFSPFLLFSIPPSVFTQFFLPLYFFVSPFSPLPFTLLFFLLSFTLFALFVSLFNPFSLFPSLLPLCISNSPSFPLFSSKHSLNPPLSHKFPTGLKFRTFHEPFRQHIICFLRLFSI